MPYSCVRPAMIDDELLTQSRRRRNVFAGSHASSLIVYSASKRPRLRVSATVAGHADL